MSLTFLGLQQELADRTNLDQTISANATRLKRWLNMIQQDIASRYPWEWLYSNTFIQTVTDYTTGTITGSAGSTSITGLGTNWTSAYLNAYLQPANDTNWYQVSTVGGTTSITLTKGLAAAVTAGTYILRTTYYDLPSNCFKVYDVRQTNTPRKLTNLGLFTLDAFRPDIQTTNISQPTGYFLFGEDPLIAVTAQKQTLIGFFPTPDNIYNIQVRYILTQSDLSGDTDIPFIPVQYYGVLLDGAEYLASKFLNSQQESELKQSYEYSIEKMIEMENAHNDYFPIIGSSDTGTQSKFLQFPANFENPV